MKNTLADLNNYLFEQLERLQDDELEPEELEKELKRSKAVQGIAHTIIDSGRLVLQAKKVMYDNGEDGNVAMPLLGTTSK